MKTRRGTDNDNILTGSDSAEKIYGMGGNDTITGGGGNDKIWCGDNGAFLQGQWDNVDGGAGNDLIYGEGGSDFLHGGAGIDRIFAGVADDFLFGDNGKDYLSGDDGNDVIVGGQGLDTLLGGTGNDRLIAVSGNDIMKGGAGNDIYFPGANKAQTTDTAGNDEYHIDNGDASVFIFDRSGTDKLLFSMATAEKLTFVRDGYDLHIDIKGFAGETTISNYFMGKNNRIETIVDSDTTHPSGYDLSGLNALKYSGDHIDGSTLWDL